MDGYVIVFVGGGAGAALRHAANRAALAWFPVDPRFATLFVNVVGSLLMGLLVGLLLVKGEDHADLRLFLATGVLGGFTTFSAFSLDSAALWQQADYAALAAYVTGSVVVSIVALFAGLALARTLG